MRPTDALGRPTGARDPAGRWIDPFTPRYVSYFPEYYLSAIQTEHMVRDLSPLTTGVYGTPHGRRTHPAGGAPPELWITELNLESRAVEPAARERFQAKVALRSLTSFVAKGAGAVHLFAAKAQRDGQLGLIDPRFFAALRNSTNDPAGSAGLTLAAIGRLSQALEGPADINPRRLSLLAIGDYADRIQFTGDGSRAHPRLFDRDVAAVFPFQVDDNRFVIAAYVMTRDLSRVTDRVASPDRRYDLPTATYRMRLGGIRSCPLTVDALDPLDGTSVPVRVIRCSAPIVELQMALTDSPRLIRLGD